MIQAKNTTILKLKKINAKRKRNAYRRAINAALRELCGTSAAAARRDMGL